MCSGSGNKEALTDSWANFEGDDFNSEISIWSFANGFGPQTTRCGLFRFWMWENSAREKKGTWNGASIASGVLLIEQSSSGSNIANWLLEPKLLNKRRNAESQPSIDCSYEIQASRNDESLTYQWTCMIGSREIRKVCKVILIAFVVRLICHNHFWILLCTPAKSQSAICLRSPIE